MSKDQNLLKKAIFLDRDGTLIEDVGVLKNPKKIQLFPDTISSLLRLQKNYLLFVITNQSAISKGEITLAQAEAINTELNNILSKAGITIQEWYICPHKRTDNCSCIKPKPEFIIKAQKKYDLDLTQSFILGDHPHDVYTANDLGVFGLYLLTGHGGKHLPELTQDKLVFHRISNAADWILNNIKPQKNLRNKIEEAACAIRNGSVAAFPTETVYGLGADVFQPKAVEQIFTIKGRPHYNPLIAHISNLNQIDRLATNVPDKAKQLMDVFWPGPLTIVLPKCDAVPDIVTGGLPTVAIRMPAQTIALELINLCETAIAAPSANRFTCTSPTTAQHVHAQLGDKCPVIIDGGACRVGVESTVISFAGEIPIILRPGGIPIEDIESLIGPIKTLTQSAEKSAPKESPGMIPNHYAPATKLNTFNEIPIEYETRSDVGILLFKPSKRNYSGPVEMLSKFGDAKEAAANLFAALQRLDSLNLSEIAAEYAPDHSLGRAINNRLSKASNGRNEQHDQ